VGLAVILYINLIFVEVIIWLMKIKRSKRGLVIYLSVKDIVAGTVEEGLLTLLTMTIADYYAERSSISRDTLRMLTGSVYKCLE